MVGEALRDAASGQGFAARLGDDEFIGVMSAGLNETEKILEQMTKRLKQEDAQVTLSIGMMKIKPGLHFAELMEKADSAMYETKRLVKSRIIRFKRD